MAKYTWQELNGKQIRHNTGTLCHVRGLVDGRVVVRSWEKGRWRYSLTPLLNIEQFYTIVPPTKPRGGKLDSVEMKPLTLTEDLADDDTQEGNTSTD